MQYEKIIQPSGRKSIFQRLPPPKDPDDNDDDPPVVDEDVDEDLPEPTEPETDTIAHDDDDDEDALTREQQIIIESINRDETKADLQDRYNTHPSFNFEDIDANLFVLGQIPRGTPVEPVTDPEEQQAIEKTWTNAALLKILSTENALSTGSGDASKALDDSKLASYKYNYRFMQEIFYQKYYLFNTEIATYEHRLNLKKNN